MPSKNRRLLENLFSLSILQLFNFILPLITLPYLVRVLGPDKFGLLSFVLSLMQILIIITDYGFNLSATKQVSIYRNNMSKLTEITNSVLLIKVALLTFCSSFIFIIANLTKYSGEVVFILLFYGMVIGQAITPIWFFQGIEKMKFITILNVLSKLIFTLGIFIFVENDKDMLLIAILYSLGYLVSGFSSLWIVRYKFGIKYEKVSFQIIVYQLKQGWYVFLSSAATSLYTVSNSFILGLLTNTTIVGYYSPVEKIVNAANSVVNIISQAVFPHINRLLVDNKNRGMQFIKKLLFMNFTIFLILSIFLLVFANKIILLLFGSQYSQSIVLLQIMAAVPLLVSISNILGVQTMLSLGFEKMFAKIIIIGGIINVVLAFFLVPDLNHLGTAIGVVSTELIITVIMCIFLRKKNIGVI